MKTTFSVFMFLLFFQLAGQAWPNNLVFTLKPSEGVEFKNNTLGFEIIEENKGKSFIGKFKKLQQAEVAQERLSSVGIETEMCAFFRAERINIEDAKILSANMNQQEESTMLSNTSYKHLPEDRITLEPLPKENEKPIAETDKNTPKAIAESPSSAIKTENIAEANAFFTIQIGVFSTSAKHKFKMKVNERVINGKYYCFYGQYFSIEDAKKQLMTLKDKGYNDAFITGFDRGNKVSPTVVKDIIKSL